MGEGSFGKYRLIAELGHGGMADVFLAVMAGPVGSGFSKLTVVKRLRQNLAEEPEFIEMLVDEARISARLNHPNVVQTNEVGSVDNQYFISMEYLDGQPLHRIQHRAAQKAQKALAEAAAGAEPVAPQGRASSSALPTAPFPKECQYLVIVDTLAGLHHAHSLADYDGTPLEIVHRDVTPHNIFVTYEGQTKVVDFGIAKAVGRSSETRQGVVKGKVRYMAPEQAIGQAVDRRADLFSVGIMLWEAATGRRLWKDMDDLNIVQALVGGNMSSSPREIDPTIPETVDRICRKALAFNVEDRYATAEDFRIDLEQYLAESGLLLSARRKLATVVADLFSDKREEIKGVIEKQLAQIATRSAVDLKPVAVALESASASARTVPLSSAGAVSVPVDPPDGEAPTSITDAATALYKGSSNNPGRAAELSAPPLRPRSRLPLAVSVGAGMLIAAAALVIGRRVYLSEGAAAVLPKSSGAETTTTSAEVKVKISTDPIAAQVSIDGAPVATPSDARMPRDGREHLVRVEAPGFEPHIETVRFENDLAMTVVLTTRAAATATPSTTLPRSMPPPRWTPPPPRGPAPPPPQVVTANTAATIPATTTAKPKFSLGDKEDPWGDAGKR